MKRSYMETVQILQMIFTALATLAAILAAIFAWQIGSRQIQIAELQDFAEVFLMPQAILNNQQQVVSWKILIKNASSYPIYLESYTLNGFKTDVGNSAVPNNQDSWYGVPILQKMQEQGEFSLLVNFVDYRGRHYETEGFGRFINGGWEIKSKKRVELLNLVP